ncbi:MAG: CHAT domain-containing protein [Micrococcales bacterium]|nr:CHAT domain-containing protein [Micrococcales bacterium]
MAGRPVEAAHALHAALAELERIGGVAGPGEEDAERRAELLELRCNILITLALTEFFLSGLEAARTRLAEAELVIDELGDDNLRARLDYQRADLSGRAGDLTAAWHGLAGAVRHLDAFTAREQCSVHLSRGMLAFERSQPKQALESFASAARLARAEGFPQQEFMARHNMGFATYLLGDLPRALMLMSEADEIRADVSRGPARLDRGEVLLEAGLVSEAIEMLRSGLARLDRDGHGQLRAEHDVTLSRAERLAGHPDEAAVAASRARVAFADLGATGWEAKAVLAELVLDLDRPLRPQRSQRESTAFDGLSVAARVARTADDVTIAAIDLGNRDLAAAAQILAAEALLRLGDLAGALARLDEAGRRRIGSLSDDLRRSSVLAAVTVAAGKPVAARRLLARAARQLEAGQRGSASLDLRTARSIHGVSLAALDLDLAAQRGSADVLRTLERWRGATERLPSLGRSEDARLAELTESLRSIRGQLRGEPDPDRVRALEERSTRLELQIRARDWQLSSAAAPASHVRIQEARASLVAADRDLIWFFTHRQRLFGVGIVGGRAAVRDIMPLEEAVELARRVRVDLRTAATQRLGPFGHAVWGSLRSSAEHLDEGLIRPWRSSRGLVLVSCEQVSALPWALLPSLVGRPFTLARSLTSFARAESRAASCAPGPGSGRPPIHITVGPGVARGPSEAAAIAMTWGDDVPVTSPSSSADLVRALAGAGVVHVAAHGTHAVESPLFSSVSLHDGPVFAHELQPTGVGADHVVLSACDVGLASSRPGNEELGLARSMLSLGARSVVAAVAPLPDDVAADVMTRHHRALATGAASDAALATAIAASDPVAAAFLNLGGRFVPTPGR